jgi:UDP-N-acetylglucosamine diphosphorylase/glucosamine-1-phosphate N-acetyltransferase
MNIFLFQSGCFSYRGTESFRLDLLGKDIFTRMCENLQVTPILEDSGATGLYLYPAFPFLRREETETFLNAQDKNVAFQGGYFRCGEGDFVQITTPFKSGVFSLSDYSAAFTIAATEVNERLLSQGVLVERGAQIDTRAVIGSGAKIEGSVRIVGACQIGENVELCGISSIVNSKIGANTVIRSSVLEGASIGENCTVGPFAYLRANSRIGANCRIGDFVEIKNATVGDGCKASHLAYVGDCGLGKRVNVGCGVVFANYNGRTKSRSKVGNDCFLGSNCNLVAPVTLGDSVYVAAGTTLTCDLQSDDFCIGRCRETVKPNRARKYLPPKKT